LRDRNRRILLGRVIETGLVGTEIPFVRPRPVYSSLVPFVCPFNVDTGAPSATAGSTSGPTFSGNSGVLSSMGESGGGGMFVPAVRESRGARTGSSNRPREVLVPLGRRVAEGIVPIQRSGSARMSLKMIVLGPEYVDVRNAAVNS
jgi:hypothetical protein